MRSRACVPGRQRCKIIVRQQQLRFSIAKLGSSAQSDIAYALNCGTTQARVIKAGSRLPRAEAEGGKGGVSTLRPKRSAGKPAPNEPMMAPSKSTLTTVPCMPWFVDSISLGKVDDFAEKSELLRPRRTNARGTR